MTVFATNYTSEKMYLQDGLSIWWTRDTARDVERHTGEEKGILIKSLALLCQLSRIKQFSNRQTPAGQECLMYRRRWFQGVHFVRDPALSANRPNGGADDLEA